MPTTRRLNRSIQAATLALLPAIIVFLVVPVQIFTGNQAEFNYDYRLINILYLGLCCLFILLTLCFHAAGNKINDRISRIFFFAGLYLFFSYLLIPVQVDDLVGSNALDSIAEPPLLSLLEVLILAFLLVVFKKISWEKIRPTGTLLVCLLFAGISAVYVFQANWDKKELTDWADISPQENKVIGNKPDLNIYHFIFDSFDGYYFDRFVSEVGLGKSFNGFTWYKNAVANYSTTSLSFPSFMTGSLFDFDKPLDKEELTLKLNNDGIIRTLKNTGFTVSQYTSSQFFRHQLADNRLGVEQLEKSILGNDGFMLGLVKLVDLSLLVAAPNFLQDETFHEGRGLTARFFIAHDSLVANWEKRLTYLSYRMMDRVVADEHDRPSAGQYVVSYFWFPHSPYVLNRDCEIDLTMEFTPENAHEQSLCTVRSMASFIDTLKEQGKFEKSLIIMQSDHGQISRSGALMLVKPPGTDSTGLLRRSNQYAQLVDIAPTIYDSLSIESGDLSGDSLFSDKITDDREIHLVRTTSNKPLGLHFSTKQGVIFERYPPVDIVDP